MRGGGARRRAVLGVTLWLISAVAFSLPCLGAEPSQAETQEPASDTLRIAVIGASVSAGFGTGIKLADVLDAAIESPKTITDLSELTFFLDPEGYGEQVVMALGRKSFSGVMIDPDGGEQEVVMTITEDPPDAVIGIDFLFWFAYGDMEAAERKALLQKGLAFLEKIECPVLVGDVPKVPKSFMLDADQIPSDEELEVLNAMIVEWATAHERVTVYPLAALIESIRKGEPVEINGEERTFKPSEVFTIDRLHVTKTGIVALTALILETLSEEGGPLADAKLVLDPDRIAERVKPQEATAPAEE